MSQIRQARVISHSTEASLIEKSKNQQWYKKTRDFDDGVFALLVVGGTIVGGGMTAYNSADIDDDNFIRFGMGLGAVVGGFSGAGTWFFYPYPATYIALTTGSLLFWGAPVFFKTIRSMVDGSKKEK